MDEITTVGIDLAKEVFAVCILDARGALVERKGDESQRTRGTAMPHEKFNHGPPG